MAHDDQNFDEFDNLVDDDTAFQDEAFPENAPYKKKSKAGLYIFLLLIIAGAGSAAWFLFLRPVDAPLSTMQESAPQDVATPSMDSLPPGISVSDEEPGATPSYESAREEIASISDENADMPLDETQDIEPEIATPEEAPLEPSAATGMTAEALPPPVVMSMEDTPSEDNNAAELAADDAALQEAAPETEATEVADSTIEATLPEPDAAPIAAIEPQEAPVTPAPAPSVVPAAPMVEAEPVASPQTDARLSQVEEQLRTLSADISTTKQSVQNIAQQPSSDADTTSLQSELRALSSKLDNLAQQVESLDQRTTTLATELQNQDTSAPVAAPRVIEPKKEEPKAETVKPVTPKPVVKAAPKPAPAPSSTAVAGWELKSAQPGVAWLGRKGTSEMTRYSVGQNVQGLGTIKAVRQEGGRWIVETTNGTIRQ